MLRLFVVADVIAHDAKAVFLLRVGDDAEHRHFAVAGVAGMGALAAAVLVVAEVETVGLYRAVEVAAALAVEDALLVADAADAGFGLQRAGGVGADVLRGGRVRPRAAVVVLVFQRLAKFGLRGDDRRRREVVLRAVSVGGGEVGFFFGVGDGYGEQWQEAGQFGFHYGFLVGG